MAGKKDGTNFRPKQPLTCNSPQLLVGHVGFEPTTNGLRVPRTIVLNQSLTQIPGRSAVVCTPVESTTYGSVDGRFSVEFQPVAGYRLRMLTLLMIASMIAGILLLQISPVLSMLCWVVTYYTGRAATAEDEAHFMGVLFVLAVIGFFAGILQGIISHVR